VTLESGRFGVTRQAAVEGDAEIWVRPAPWADKKGHVQVGERLRNGRKVHKIA